jgi:hypothetical protein
MNVEIKRGSEGPKHDPYAFEETTVVSTDGKVEATVHEGLDVFLKVGNERILTYADVRGPNVHIDWLDEALYRKIDEWFEKEFGATFTVIMRVFRRRKARLMEKCVKCGSRKLEWYKGYPGESILVCNECGNPNACEFNESAVI